MTISLRVVGCHSVSQLGSNAVIRCVKAESDESGAIHLQSNLFGSGHIMRFVSTRSPIPDNYQPFLIYVFALLPYELCVCVCCILNDTLDKVYSTPNHCFLILSLIMAQYISLLSMYSR